MIYNGAGPPGNINNNEMNGDWLDETIGESKYFGFYYCADNDFILVEGKTEPFANLDQMKY